MGKVIEDLKEAFAGESQATTRYLIFAEKADTEGHTQAARLFRAAAAAEVVHARNHLRVLDCVRTTAENLQEAIAGENYEWVSMYPAFMNDAEAEGDKKAHRSFSFAFEVEKVHEQLFREMAENLGKVDEEFEYYVCPVCGYTHARNAPDKCPVCGVPGDKFEVVR